MVLRLLEKGVHVHLFSDHVPPDDELELKKYAKERGLLVMGPAAGTAIVAGKAIGFANVVKRGKVGIVAAAGTGLQEVSALLSEAGIGISQALGTGGGDVKSNIGGLMMLQSIDALEKDPETEEILVVSKPPDDNVLNSIIEHLVGSTRKRYVTCFIGAIDYDLSKIRGRVRRARTLHAATFEMIRTLKPNASRTFGISKAELQALANRMAKGLNEKQMYIRGLYTGGTLAYETLFILESFVGGVYSNAPIDSKFKLADSSISSKDSIIDLGEEEFTVGRAHPMIDPTIRKIRLIEEAKDPQVAVIAMDFVLGYGSNADPAGAMLQAITEARQMAGREGRILPIFAHVCGTKEDPQILSQQNRKLREAGVELFQTNALMAIAAALTSRRGTISDGVLDGVWERMLTSF